LQGHGPGRPSSPIWSCSARGLPCRRHRCLRGGLLPHLFTLTLGVVPGTTGNASVAGPKPQAVCFLWHFPFPADLAAGTSPRVPNLRFGIRGARCPSESGLSSPSRTVSPLVLPCSCFRSPGLTVRDRAITRLTRQLSLYTQPQGASREGMPTARGGRWGRQLGPGGRESCRSRRRSRRRCRRRRG